MQWRGKSLDSMGDVGNAIESARTVAEANDFWDAYVEDIRASGSDDPVAVAISNVGYWMGYTDKVTAERIARLFPQATHPVFGRGFGRGYEPTPAEAFAAGVRLGQGGNQAE